MDNTLIDRMDDNSSFFLQNGQGQAYLVYSFQPERDNICYLNLNCLLRIHHLHDSVGKLKLYYIRVLLG